MLIQWVSSQLVYDCCSAVVMRCIELCWSVTGWYIKFYEWSANESMKCRCVECIYTYKRVVCVCLLVCPLFIGHTTFVHFAALPPSFPRAAKPSRAAPRGRRGQALSMHSDLARARARMPYNFSRCADAFQKQNRTRARMHMLSYVIVHVTADIFKKREKENQHATSQVQFTVCLLLGCLLFESY